MGKQKVTPISGWDKAAYQIEAWSVFCRVFLGDNRVHPMMYDMFLLLEEKSGVNPWLQVHDRQQHTSPAALLRLIWQELYKSFRQALEWQQLVRCTNFESLRRALATGNFRPDLVSLLGGLAPPY